MRFDGPQLGANFDYNPATSSTPKVRKIDENKDFMTNAVKVASNFINSIFAAQTNTENSSTSSSAVRQ